jgi:hypothetical protein
MENKQQKSSKEIFMKISMKIFISLWLVCSMIYLQAQNKDAGYSAAVAAKIKAVENNLWGWVQIDDSNAVWNIMDRMKFYRVKGLTIAVIHNHKIEWARGYGFADESEHRPVTVNTLFQAGSISKSLNSVGAMKLVQEKKLGLDEDINKYLKTWKFPYDSVSKGRVITLRNLLSHSAGLTIHGFPGYEVGDSLPSIYQVLNGQRPANTDAVRSMIEPGMFFIYEEGSMDFYFGKDENGKPSTIIIKNENQPDRVFKKVAPGIKISKTFF